MPRMSRRLSSIATERRATPSSPEVLKNSPNFHPSYTAQRAVKPTRWNGRGEWTTPNASGAPATAGVGTAFGAGTMESPPSDAGATRITE